MLFAANYVFILLGRPLRQFNIIVVMQKKCSNDVQFQNLPVSISREIF